MVGDVLEREVVSSECSEQHRRRDKGCAEGGDERGLCGLGKPATLLPRRERTCDERVHEQQERRDERRSAEVGHSYRLGEYFEGHFVTSVSGTATKAPLRSCPSTTTSRPVRKRSGTEPL